MISTSTVYGVVVVKVTSSDAWSARAMLERKMRALSDLAGDLIHETSVQAHAQTPEQAVTAHANLTTR